MNCSEAKALLLPYLHGEVARSERALMRAHLDECATCRAALADAEQREADLRRALAGQADRATVSSRAWMRLEASLQAERRPRRRRWFDALGGLSVGITRLAASAMAIAVVAVAGVQLVPRSAAIAPTPFVVQSPSPNVADLPPLATAPQGAAPLAVAPLTEADAPIAADASPAQRMAIPVTPMSGELADEAIAVKPCGACGRSASFSGSGLLIPLPTRLQVFEDGVLPSTACAVCLRVK